MGRKLRFKCTNETKRKMSLNHRKFNTKETRIKISIAQTGKHYSKETNKKKGLHAIGNKYVLGKHWKLSEETKQKMSIAQSGKKHPYLSDYNKKRKGIFHHREETKKKISNSTLGEKNHFFGKKHSFKTKLLFIQNGINSIRKSGKLKISKAELKLKDYLIQNNINHIHQFQYKYGIADFYLPDNNLIIECNGSYWHSRPDYIERDKRKIAYLTSQGFNVLTLNSEDIMSGKENLCLCKIKTQGGIK